jgi:hypothetical protein
VGACGSTCDETFVLSAGYVFSFEMEMQRERERISAEVRPLDRFRASFFQNKQMDNERGCRYLFHAGFFLGLFFDPEDGGDMFLRNVS